MTEGADIALVDLLLEDPRMPVRRIAERLGVAPRTARQRLDRLRENGVVRIVGLVDPAVLGRPVVIFLTVTVRGDVFDAAHRIAAVYDVQWLAVAADLRTLLLQASVATNADLLQLVDERVRTVAGVEHVSVDLGLRSSATAFRYGRDVRGRAAAPASAGEEAEPTDRSPLPWLAGYDAAAVDAVDVAMLRALQDDGRRSFTALSRSVGLSVPATRQRYLRLTRAGLLHIQCRPDLRTLGLEAAATVCVAVRASARAVADRIADLPEATWVTETTGSANVRAELVCTDLSHLAATVATIQSMPEVVGADLLVHQSIVKSTARWS